MYRNYSRDNLVVNSPIKNLDEMLFPQYYIHILQNITYMIQNGVVLFIKRIILLYRGKLEM